jgi:uncharacterized membrane protein
MNSTKLSNKVDAQKLTAPNCQPQRQPISQEAESQKLTRGQHLADALAAKVGSWAFLIGQTTVLAGWIGANTLPGVPHWDQSPFILLNLVFSFASAYTAPVVLMSQNRQSEEDRKKAAHNHEVNLRAAQNLELLHEKIEQLSARQVNLGQTLQQHQATQEIKVSFLPIPAHPTTVTVSAPNSPVSSQAAPVVLVLPPADMQTQGKFSDKLANGQLFDQNQMVWDGTKLLIKLPIESSKSETVCQLMR